MRYTVHIYAWQAFAVHYRKQKIKYQEQIERWTERCRRKQDQCRFTSTYCQRFNNTFNYFIPDSIRFYCIIVYFLRFIIAFAHFQIESEIKNKVCIMHMSGKQLQSMFILFIHSIIAVQTWRIWHLMLRVLILIGEWKGANYIIILLAWAQKHLCTMNLHFWSFHV